MIGTPQARWREMHQSGRVAIMLPMRSSPQDGIPFHFLDRFERVLAQVVAVHADEPLFGGAEDGGVVAAPAMRIAVLDLAHRQQRAGALQDFDDDRVAFPDGLAEQFFGQLAWRAFGLEEAAGAVDGAIHRESVLDADHVVFLTVAGSGVHCAGALFERYVLAQHADGIAFEKRMTEDGLR